MSGVLLSPPTDPMIEPKEAMLPLAPKADRKRHMEQPPLEERQQRRAQQPRPRDNPLQEDLRHDRTQAAREKEVAAKAAARKEAAAREQEVAAEAAATAAARKEAAAREKEVAAEAAAKAAARKEAAAREKEVAAQAAAKAAARTEAAAREKEVAARAAAKEEEAAAQAAAREKDVAAQAAAKEKEAAARAAAKEEEAAAQAAAKEKDVAARAAAQGKAAATSAVKGAEASGSGPQQQPFAPPSPTAILSHQPATVAIGVLLAVTSQNAKDQAEIRVAQSMMTLDLQHKVNMYSYEMLMHRRAHLYYLVASTVMHPGTLPTSREVVESHAIQHADTVNME